MFATLNYRKLYTTFQCRHLLLKTRPKDLLILEQCKTNILPLFPLPECLRCLLYRSFM